MIPEPLRVTTNTTIDKTQRLQAEFKETHQLYRDTVDIEKALTKNFFSEIEKQHLQAIDIKIMKIITKHLLEVTQHLFDNDGQLLKTVLNEHENSFKEIVYILIESLSTIFTQIKDIRMLSKVVNNPYL